MAYFCTCTFIDPPVRKGNKTLPDANTHSIVKQNYVKKLKRKRKNIQYKKREREKKEKKTIFPANTVNPSFYTTVSLISYNRWLLQKNHFLAGLKKSY